MNNVANVASAATAMLVAVVGITLLLPSPLPSAMPRLNLTATGSAAGLPRGARLMVTEAGVRFSLRVPTAGWEDFRSTPTTKSPRGRPISLNKSIVGAQGAEAIVWWTSFPDSDYADPCARLLGRAVGPSAAALAAAVSTAPGTKLVKGPVDVTLGGQPAKHVVLTVRENVGCDPGFFFTWPTDMGGAFWTRTDVRATIRVWIVAVGGTRLFIAATTAEEGAKLKSQVRQIVTSIRFA